MYKISPGFHTMVKWKPGLLSVFHKVRPFFFYETQNFILVIDIHLSVAIINIVFHKYSIKPRIFLRLA